MDHFVGVDLGKFVDPTALCVLCRSLAIDKASGLPLRGARGENLYAWEARALKRYPLGTAYTSIVSDVVRIVQRPELQPYPRLVIDSTGVGAPVAEMFTAALRNLPTVESHFVSITSGENFSNVTNLTRVNMLARGVWRVSKSQLIGAIRAVLEQRRFKISPDPETGKPIEHAAVLIRELQSFREKITESGNTTWEARQGAHDDLILSACLPIFIGSQPFCHMRTHATVDESSYLRPRETIALDASRAEVEQLELAAIELERSGRNLHTEREAARQKRRDAEFDANLDSDELWDHGLPPRGGSTWLIIKADDAEVLDGNLSRCSIAADVFRDASGKAVQRRGGWLVESYGHVPFARRLIEANALGDVLSQFKSLEEV